MAYKTPTEWMIENGFYTAVFKRRNGQLIDEYTAEAVMKAYIVDIIADFARETQLDPVAAAAYIDKHFKPLMTANLIPEADTPVRVMLTNRPPRPLKRD